MESIEEVVMVKRVSVLAIFGFLFASLVAPTSLLAQQETPQQAPAQDQWGEVISAVNNIDQELQELQQATDLTENDVEVVDVSEMARESERGTSLDEATSQNAQQIDQLRQTITNNDAINSKLTNQGVSTDNVVAVNVEQDGTVTVYHKSS